VVAVLLAVCALALLGPSPTALAAPARSSYRVQRLCQAPRPRTAACLALKLVPASHVQANADASARAAGGSSPAVTYPDPFAGFLTPQNLHAAYSLPTETAASSLQTVAVIDAFDDPSAEADLGVYDSEFGLPACTSANGCFRKINQAGNTSPLPAKNGGWASEISVDVQMAHAICQSCRVLLVEADNTEFTNLGAAVDTAASAGATEISNSYAGSEEPAFSSFYTEVNTDYYNHPGLVLTASSGDCGYLNQACEGEVATANFPASSPDMIAVGGTSLTDTGDGWSSTVWEDGGSGCSGIFTAPLWQSEEADFAATGCGSERSVADVAAIGDPETGVDIYDSTPEFKGGPTGWTAFGGTSVSSPIIAAEFGLAGGSHGVAYPAATLYEHAGEAGALYDVVAGSNGSCAPADTACRAAVGYDGPTGVGSPIGLSAFSIPENPTNISPPTISGVVEQGATLSATPGTWTNAPTSRSDQWERCNASGTGCAAISGATAQTYTLAATDVGSTIRVQETATNVAGSGPPADSAQTVTVASDVLTLVGFTPASGITGSAVTIEGSAFGLANSVRFGALAANFKVLSGARIEATVPNGARPGKITVTSPAGSVTSHAKFKPSFSVTSIKPLGGPPGTLVQIKGVGFDAPSVSFDGVAASLVSASAKKVKVLVPAGAGAGPIAVTNAGAPVGTVDSASSFTP
jgi:hypothetical protein